MQQAILADPSSNKSILALPCNKIFNQFIKPNNDKDNTRVRRQPIHQAQNITS